MRLRGWIALGTVSGIVGCVSAAAIDGPLPALLDGGTPDGAATDADVDVVVVDGAPGDAGVEAAVDPYCDGVKPVPPAATSCSRAFGDNAQQYATSVSVDGQGNIFLVGSFDGTLDPTAPAFPGRRGDNVFVVKHDPSCVELWSKSLASTGGDNYAAGIDCRGNVYVAGSLLLNSTPDAGTAPVPSQLVKVSPTGAELWKASPLGTAGNGEFRNPLWRVGRKGTVFIAGSYCGYAPKLVGGTVFPPKKCSSFEGPGEPATFIAALNRDGAHIFSKPLGPSTIKGMAVSDDVIALSTADGLLTILSTFDGSVRSQKAMPSFPAGTATIAINAAEEVVLVRSDTPEASLTIEKLAKGGASMWSKTIAKPVGASLPSPSPAPAQQGFEVALSSSGAVHVVGVASPAASMHPYLVSLDPAGNVVGQGTYAAAGIHVTPHVGVGPSGEVVMAGGFVGESIDLGDGARANPFSWSSQVFVARNPSRTSLDTLPARPPDPADVPELVVDAPAVIGSFAITGSGVFWTEKASVGAGAASLSACAKSGCGPGPTSLRSNVSSRSLVATSSTAFVAPSPETGFLRCTEIACTADDGGKRIDQIAVGPSTIIFHSIAPTGYWRCPVDDCTAPLSFTSYMSGTSPVSMVISSTSVALGLDAVRSPTILGTGESLVYSPSLALSLAGTDVLMHEGYTISRCAKTGCGATRTVLGSGFTTAATTAPIASDAVSVYFMDNGSDGFAPPWVVSPAQTARLMKCPIAGCPAAGPTILATGVVGAIAAQVDDTHVYFVVRTDHDALVRLPK